MFDTNKAVQLICIFVLHMQKAGFLMKSSRGARWVSGRALDSGARGWGFAPLCFVL